jgi:uncharacterized protein
MTPLFFGYGERRLFGIYHPAGGAGARSRAVVICHPWGQEYLRAHRSLKQLAVMLSQAGCHVLRFDYFGTGDSGGELVDADLEGWVDDIEAAVQEIQDTSGASRVTVAGMRLGATLAAMAAARQNADIDGLVLWDPVISGSSYLRELMATEAWTAAGLVQPPARPTHAGGGHEILGFALTTRTQRDLRQLELVPLVPELPSRLLALATGQSAEAERLRQALAVRSAGALAIEDIPCLPAWLEDRNTGAGAIPLPAMQRIVQWIP